MSIQTSLTKSNVEYDIKLYIKDAPTSRDPEWVDFTDRCEVRGKNKLYDIRTISHKTEQQAAISNFITSGVTVSVDNSDNFWDNPSLWTGFITEEGNTAAWSNRLSEGGNEIYLHNLPAKITAKSMDESGVIYENVLGHFVVDSVDTSTDVGIAQLKLNSKAQILKNLNAERVKDGRQWYINRPTKFLVKELLKQERSFVNTDGEILDSFNISDKFTLPAPKGATGDREQYVSVYGRPPQQTVNGLWRNQEEITRAIAWGDIGNGNRMYMGIGDELWEWNPGQDLYTSLGSVTTDYDIINVFINESTNTIHVVAVDSLEYALNATGELRTYTTAGGLSAATTLGDINPIHFNIRKGHWSYVHDESEAFVGLNVTSGSNGEFIAAENLALPFSQKVTSLNSSSSLSSTVYTEPINGSLEYLDNLDVNLLSVEQSNKSSGYYYIRNYMLENSISNVTINSATFDTSDPDNPGANSFLDIEFKSRNGSEVTILYTLSFTIDDTDNSYTVSHISGNAAVSSGILYADFTFTGDNTNSRLLLADIGFDIDGAVVGNNKTLQPIRFYESLSFDVINDNRQAYYSADGTSSVYHWLGHDVTYTDSTHAGTFSSDGSGSFAYSNGAFPQSVYNSTMDKVYYWRALNNTARPQMNYYLVSDDVTYFDSYAFRSATILDIIPVHLQPTAMCSSPSSAELYIASLMWVDRGTINNSYTFIHKMSLNLDSVSYFSTSLSSSTTTPASTLTVNSTSGFDKGDIVIIDRGGASEEWTTIISVDSSTQVTVHNVGNHNSGQSVEILAKTLYRLNEYYTITEMHLSGTSLIMSAVKRDKLNAGTAFHLGYRGTSESITTGLFAGANSHNFIQTSTQFRGIVSDSDDANKFYTATSSGQLWEFDKSADQITYTSDLVNAESNVASNLVSVPEAELDAIDNLTRTLSPVFGISAPAYPDYTSIDSYTGKYYLWKYDQFLADRIELADFTDLTVWEALSLLAQSAQAIMGFDLDNDGNFFFIDKDYSSSDDVVYTEFDNIDPASQLISLSKNRGINEIYNYTSINPYYTRLGELSFTYYARDAERENIVEEDDIFLNTKSLINTNIRLVCVKEGYVNAQDSPFGNLGDPPRADKVINAPLYKWKTFETNIEARVQQTYSPADTGTNLYLWSLFRGGIPFKDSQGVARVVENGININDFIEVTDSDTNITEVRKITDGDIDAGYVTLESDFTFSLTTDTVVTVYKSITDKGLGIFNKGWSDDSSGVTTLTSSTVSGDTSIEVADSRQLNRHTVIQIGSNTEYYRIKSIDGTTVNLFDTPGTVQGSYSIGTAVKAYFSPYAAIPDELDTIQKFNPVAEQVYQSVGDTNISVKFDPSEFDKSFIEQGDSLEVNFEGLILQKDDKSTQISSHETSREKYGRLEFPTNDNRFLGRASAKLYALLAVEKYHYPKYSFTIEYSFDPLVRFVTDNGKLYRVDLRHNKFLPVSPYRRGYIRAISHDVKSGITTIETKDDDFY